jgi:hypothetical protein
MQELYAQEKEILDAKAMLGEIVGLMKEVFG